MKTKIVLLFGVLFFMVVMSIGCGNPRVHGRVVYSDDKTPVERGVVNFVTDNYIARGPIDKNGYYNVGSTKAGNGLPKGDYRIYITSTVKILPPENGGGPTYVTVIQLKYEKPDTSGLTLNVTGSQKFDIEVDRYDASTDSAKKR
jgi:hypothetical protein